MSLDTQFRSIFCDSGVLIDCIETTVMILIDRIPVTVVWNWDEIIKKYVAGNVK